MANLNLSQFTEKTLVADADWVFVWDTAGAISKKVSRNSLLNSGTLTTSAPVTISQTWNDAAVAFTALKVNATTPGTTSSSSSLLLDLQVGGVSKFYVNKAGDINTVTGVNCVSVSGTTGFFGGSVRLNNNAAFLAFGSPSSVVLQRDDADNTLALRNSTAAQTFNVYGTYTSGTSYERLSLSAPTTANAIIGTNKGSGGGTARGLDLHTDGTARWTISTAGHLLGAADNTYDIGASGANRPRDIFAGNNFIGSGGYLVLGVAGGVAKVQLDGRVTNNLTLTNSSQNDFGRLNFGSAADTHPAIARDGAGIKFTGGAAGSTSWVKVPPVAVSALPLAATAGVGARAFVNDALTPVFGSAVANGGSAKVPVYSDGSAWYVG